MSIGLNDLELAKVIKVLSKLEDVDSCFFFYQDDDSVTVAVNCNDYFYWGCADCEVITVSDLEDIEKFCLLCNSTSHSAFYGLQLWSSWKRRQLPQEAILKKWPEERKELFKSVIKDRS